MNWRIKSLFFSPHFWTYANLASSITGNVLQNTIRTGVKDDCISQNIRNGDSWLSMAMPQSIRSTPASYTMIGLIYATQRKKKKNALDIHLEKCTVSSGNCPWFIPENKFISRHECKYLFRIHGLSTQGKPRKWVISRTSHCQLTLYTLPTVFS